MRLGERLTRLSRLAVGVVEPRPGAPPQEAGPLETALEATRSPLFAVVLAGGTRVGKSTLLDALAGAEVSAIGATAATTRALTVLCPTALARDEGLVARALALGADDRIVAASDPGSRRVRGSPGAAASDTAPESAIERTGADAHDRAAGPDRGPASVRVQDEACETASSLAAGQDCAPVVGNTVLVDTPDFDSYMASNRERLLALLPRAHVVLAVVTPEKYRDASLYALLARERARRGVQAIAVVLNKVDGRCQDEVEAIVADLAGVLATQGLSGAPVFPLSARNALNARLARAPACDPRLSLIAALERFLRDQQDRVRQDEIRRSNLRASVATAVREVEGRYGLSHEILDDVLDEERAAREALHAEVPAICARVAGHMAGCLWGEFALRASAAARGPLSLYLHLWSRLTGAVPAGADSGRAEGGDGGEWADGAARSGATPAGPAAWTAALPQGPSPWVQERILADRLLLGLKGALARYVGRRAQSASSLSASVLLSAPLAGELAGAPSGAAALHDATGALGAIARESLDRCAPPGPPLWLMRVLSVPATLLVYLAPMMAIYEYVCLRPDAAIAVALMLPLVGGALLELTRQLLLVVGHGRVARAQRRLERELEAGVLPLLSGVGREEGLTVLGELSSELGAVERDAVSLELTR